MCKQMSESGLPRPASYSCASRRDDCLEERMLLPIESEMFENAPVVAYAFRTRGEGERGHAAR